VIGHECGHGAFSPSRTLNDTVGYALHTLLLVPYFAWQYTHAKHHKYTNHLVHGETHVPPNKEEASIKFNMISALGDRLFAIYELISHLLFGWPAYLLFNATGGRVSYKGEKFSSNSIVDHFRSSNSSLFPPELHFKILLSALGCGAVVIGLAIWGFVYGWTQPLRWYILPYVVSNFWLVLYTWLHHSHPEVPNYGDDEYTWLRGALSTIDRPYPWLVDKLHLGIGSTHVLHHIDAKVPHYHAKEATWAVKAALGPFYRYDPRSIVDALWDVCTSCHYVEGQNGIQFLKAVSSKEAAAFSSPLPPTTTTTTEKTKTVPSLPPSSSSLSSLNTTTVVSSSSSEDEDDDEEVGEQVGEREATTTSSQ